MTANERPDDTDVTGLGQALGDNEELFTRVMSKVHDGRPPQSLLGGYLDEAEEEVTVRPYDRRNALRFFRSALAYGASVYLGAGAFRTFADAEDLAQLNKNREGISEAFIANLLAHEYSDPIFSQSPPSHLTAAELAVYNSFHYMRIGEFIKLARNIRVLEAALAHCHEDKAKALILQRLVIDNNFLGSGLSAAKPHADTLLELDFRTFAGAAVPKLISRSIDVMCTAKLNALKRDDFIGFKGFEVLNICRSYARLGIDISASKDEMLRYTLAGTGASIFAAIQAKWIRELQSIRLVSDRDFNAASLIRKEWEQELLYIANGVESHKLADEMSEDFFYSLCRVAFHAFACGDQAHTRAMLALYFDPDYILRPHLAAARSKVKTRLPTNIQWIRLLQVAAALRFGEQEKARTLFLGLRADLKKLRALSSAVGRAFAKLSMFFGEGNPYVQEASILDGLPFVPSVDNQLAYYQLIAAAVDLKGG